jgi:hypothetical protein
MNFGCLNHNDSCLDCIITFKLSIDMNITSFPKHNVIRENMMSWLSANGIIQVTLVNLGLGECLF